MSGHSKWSTIKRQKGAADAKRANIFTKLAKNITLAARDGGGDPAMNFQLRLVIDKAKAANMPKDNIERAIKRGTGEGTDDAALEEITYEGYGPHGSAFIVEVVTDNRNRSAANLKHLFSARGGSLDGSVAWMFDRVGMIITKPPMTATDEAELAMIEAGAQDVRWPEPGIAEITTEPTELQKVQEALTAADFVIENAELGYRAKDEVQPTDDAMRQSIEGFCESLDDDDDVQNYWTNIAL